MISGLFLLIGVIQILYAVILTLNEGIRWYRIIWLYFGAGMILLAVNHSLIPLWIRILFGLSVLIIVAACLFVEYQNETIIKNQPEEAADIVIVLGCKVPSRAFYMRSEAAAAYWSQHSSVRIITTGGKGADEAEAEGEVFRKELIKAGIPEAQIFVETESVSTRENLQNSDRLYHIKSQQVGIVTSKYHLYRSLVIARQCGYTNVFGIPAETLLFYQPDYCLREVLALIKAKLIKSVPYI